MDADIFMGVSTLFIVIVLGIIFFFWQKRIAYDLLNEKGYGKTKTIGWLLFFMPIVCWIYICFLPTKTNND